MMGGGALGNVGSHDTRGRGQLTRRNEACSLRPLLPWGQYGKVAWLLAAWPWGYMHRVINRSPQQLRIW